MNRGADTHGRNVPFRVGRSGTVLLVCRYAVPHNALFPRKRAGVHSFTVLRAASLSGRSAKCLSCSAPPSGQKALARRVAALLLGTVARGCPSRALQPPRHKAPEHHVSPAPHTPSSAARSSSSPVLNQTKPLHTRHCTTCRADGGLAAAHWCAVQAGSSPVEMGGFSVRRSLGKAGNWNSLLRASLTDY
ncbi:hypothetical protein NDU88_002093 [Pleurodeles waltl]|uniref:Uncharacterized protein n=1 Tax=Pleurodeles waltl TaxID=8319 RepID=A0AAV7P8Y3_PLEWA|nr:hypothetical protein NDU88_002093 [Pleurodeles waltl]